MNYPEAQEVAAATVRNLKENSHLVAGLCVEIFGDGGQPHDVSVTDSSPHLFRMGYFVSGKRFNLLINCSTNSVFTLYKERYRDVIGKFDPLEIAKKQTVKNLREKDILRFVLILEKKGVEIPIMKEKMVEYFSAHEVASILSELE